MFMFWIITAIVVVEGIVVFGVLFAARLAWNEIAGANPYAPTDKESVSRSYQSIKVGFYNFGYCFKVSADSQVLHFEPQHILRWIGCVPASIPYEKIEPGKYTFFKTHRICTINRRRIYTPAWAADLIAPNTDE